MNMDRFFVICGLATSLLFSGWCFADGEHGKTPIYQMAEIMHRLKHYPSPQGKRELQAIVAAQGVTDNERIIAKAMINLEHQAAAEDIPLLKKLIANKASTDDECEIASIVLSLDHRPSKQDKDRLKELMR